MPRVGSSSKNTFGRVFSHFPNITFCWLPPESIPTMCIGEGALICSCRRYASAALHSLELLIKPNRFKYLLKTGSVRLAAIESGIARPSFRRSSVMYAMPSRWAARGEAIVTFRPSTSISPESAG